MNNYVERVLHSVLESHKHEKEFCQAVKEILTSLSFVMDKHPEYESAHILERLIEPNNIIKFDVKWIDRFNNEQTNVGYRVQFNNAVGIYKGGLRFHPSVNLSILKFLGFEQVLKNSLTGLPMGGAKGGSDFDPKDKTEKEIENFCKSFMKELAPFIGENIDVPAGDIGVGAREIDYLYEQYKKVTQKNDCALTGKQVGKGGSLIRKEATGYGLVYILSEAMKSKGDSLKNKKLIVSGSGNVAIYAVEKALDYGAKVVAMYDSNGYVYDENGIDLKVIKDIKENKRGRIKEYLEYYPCAIYSTNLKDFWRIKCDVALPCATQNEIDLESAKCLINNGCKYVAEGANMPSNNSAIEEFINSGILFIPAKAANAGGVSVSYLEIVQCSKNEFWSREKVDAELKNIMKNIYLNISNTAIEYGCPNNLVLGANAFGFERVAKAMLGSDKNE